MKKFIFDVDSNGNIGQAKCYLNNIFQDSYPHWVTSGSHVPNFSSTSLIKEIILGSGGDTGDYLHNNTIVTLNSISYII